MSFRYDRIYELRKAQGMTQGQLAEKCGITQNQISRYERGAITPLADVLATIAAALDTSADYLLGLTDAPTPGEKPAPQPSLTAPEAEMLDLLRSLSVPAQRQLIEALKIARQSWQDDADTS